MFVDETENFLFSRTFLLSRSSQDVLLKKVRTLENRMQQIVTQVRTSRFFLFLRRSCRRLQQSFMCEYLECLMEGLQTVGGENIRMPRRRLDRDLCKRAKRNVDEETLRVFSVDFPNDSSPDLRSIARRDTLTVASPTEEAEFFAPNRGEVKTSHPQVSFPIVFPLVKTRRNERKKNILIKLSR